MLQARYRLLLTSPTGEVLDLTERVSDPGTISENVVESLLELVHGDLSMQIDDHDGAFSAFIADADPDDEYALTLLRQTKRRTPKWERLFGGILDLPWSVRRDRTERVADVEVFSFSKLLERASAEDLKRTPGALLADATAASATLSITDGDYSEIVIGDVLTLSDGTNEERKTVTAVLGSGDFTMDSDYANNYSDGAVTLDTPYYRRLSVAELVALVFEQAGIDQYTVDTASVPDDVVPFPTPAKIAGLPSSGAARHTIQRSGALEVMLSGNGTYRAADGQSEWSQDDPSGVPKVDYSSQQDSEPTLVNAHATLGDRPPQHSADGTYLETYRVVDYATGDYYTLRSTLVTGPLVLLKNGTPDVTIEAAFGPAILFEYGHAYDRANARVIVWYVYGQVGSPPPTAKIKAWDGSTLTELADLTGVASGIPVTSYTVPGVDHRLGIAAYSYTDLSTGQRRVGLIEPTVTGRSFELPGLGSYLYTLRTIDRYLFFLYRVNEDGLQAYRLRVVDYDTLETVGDAVLDTRASLTHVVFLSRASIGGEDVLFGFIGRTPFVVARSYAGIVPYANFEGMSCSAALQDLALISMSMCRVDEYRIGVFRSRDSASAPEVALDTVPLERQSMPLWEHYRTSVEVTGETEDGDEIVVTEGDTGDSARRFEIDSQLITNEAVASAVAHLYARYFGTKRTQEDLTIDEPTPLLRPFDRVRFNGKLYQALDPETDLAEHEQRLTLVEV